MTLKERLDMLAEAYEKLKTIEDKTQNVQQRVHLMRRNDEFEDRKKETFSYPKIHQSPKPDDIRMSHNALKTKMAEQGAADMKAKLNNKLVDPNAALKAKLTGKR
tara:strand:+ start:100 stop:414 length:315 start_codon:yes stop_codon:yes gene_type:complete